MYKTKYKYNEKSFRELNNKSAYWIGFLLADGYIQGNRIQLALSKRDEGILKQYKDFIKSPDRPIRNFLANGKYLSVEVRIRSWSLVNDLKKYKANINKRDRGRVNIELLQEEIRRNFVRGYFDGDGCFYINKKGYMFAEITGYKPLIKDIKNILVADKIIKDTKNIVKNGSIVRIRLSATDTLKLGEYLYKDYPNIYRCDRKYNTYKVHAERLNNLNTLRV